MFLQITNSQDYTHEVQKTCWLPDYSDAICSNLIRNKLHANRGVCSIFYDIKMTHKVIHIQGLQLPVHFKRQCFASSFTGSEIKPAKIHYSKLV